MGYISTGVIMGDGYISTGVIMGDGYISTGVIMGDGYISAGVIVGDGYISTGVTINYLNIINHINGGSMPDHYKPMVFFTAPQPQIRTSTAWKAFPGELKVEQLNT